MWEDPFVKEVHETRARLLARFRGDCGAYVRHIQNLEAEDEKRGTHYVSFPPRPVRQGEPDAA
jgi:hypothetical protein